MELDTPARAPHITEASYTDFLSFLGLAVSLSSNSKFLRLLLKLDIVGFLTKNDITLQKPALTLLAALLRKLDPVEDALSVTELRRDLKSAQIEATFSYELTSNADKLVCLGLLELCR